MNGARFDAILASTALALILAAPLARTTAAQEAEKVAAAPTAAMTATAPVTETTPAAAPSEAPAAPTDAAPASSTPPAAAPAVPATPAVATEPAVAPDPLAALDPADRAVAEKMRDLLAAKSDKIFASKKERSAVETFYQNRNLAPLWFEHGVMNARAKSVIERLRVADSDGLDLKDYRIPSFDAGNPEALAEAELKFTVTVLTFARHLQAGRFPQSRISKDIEMPQQPPDPAVVLTTLADSSNVAKTLDEYSPPHEGYRKLKAKLAELRGSTAEEEKFVRIPDGPNVKPGGNDARVPLLR